MVQKHVDYRRMVGQRNDTGPVPVVNTIHNTWFLGPFSITIWQIMAMKPRARVTYYTVSKLPATGTRYMSTPNCLPSCCKI